MLRLAVGRSPVTSCFSFPLIQQVAVGCGCFPRSLLRPWPFHPRSRCSSLPTSGCPSGGIGVDPGFVATFNRQSEGDDIFLHLCVSPNPASTWLTHQLGSVFLVPVSRGWPLVSNSFNVMNVVVEACTGCQEAGDWRGLWA